MEKYDILTLDNGKDYTISQMTDIDGKTYFLLIEVDDDENILDDKIIVEFNKDTNEVVKVDDEDTCKKVSLAFTRMIIKDIDENN